MSTVTRTINASPERVWEVLADGWLYPGFVVGASRMRDVDAAWPAVGSRVHHSVGLWPALINDDTEVTESRTNQLLALRARGWPLGEADVQFRLTPTGDGSTEVTIEENVASGPGLLVPPPIKGLTITWRNIETLRRLAFIAESRR
jgi:uncharacterized protein YndB with AHSA1/START domain